jgi:3-deoxy-D-manno-octulosonic-acid transferase
MPEALARALYSLALRLLTPVYLLRLWWRGRHEPRYRERIGERLGVYRDAVPQAPTLWLHAVSLGETRAAAPLLAAWRRQWPGVRVLLTCSTATGWDAGVELLAPGDLHAWLPYDTPGAVRRFLRHHRPRLGVLMETEVWPNLLHAAEAAGVPVVLANARLSARSLARGQRFASLLRPAVARLALVLAQTDDDAQRLRAAGARTVHVCGNLKFDVTPADDLVVQGRAWRTSLARPVVLAASTREGEEAALLAAWQRVSAPRPLLLIVPRHPQRFDEVAQLVRRSGLTLRRRSQWGDPLPPDAAAADVWLGDTVGEMALYYGCADVALLGGSFAPLGGQNLIEAAACGCPVVMGPHTFNFAEAAQRSVDAGAGMRADDIDDGVRRAVALAADAARPAWAERALAFAARHRGAAACTVRYLGKWCR